MQDIRIEKAKQLAREFCTKKPRLAVAAMAIVLCASCFAPSVIAKKNEVICATSDAPTISAGRKNSPMDDPVFQGNAPIGGWRQDGYQDYYEEVAQCCNYSTDSFE